MKGKDMLSTPTLTTAIQGACDATPAFTRARRKALAAVKWRLRSPDGQYAGLDPREFYRCTLTDAEHASVFDGRDNEVMKCRYFSAVLKVPLTVELVSFAV